MTNSTFLKTCYDIVLDIMSDVFIDNTGEADYQAKISSIAAKLKTWQGPVVLISHSDPDGDALGSSLALKRALDRLGKTTYLPIDVPRYLAFLTKEKETTEALDQLPDETLLIVLDVELGERATGAPIDQAAFVINIDHHGSNMRLGDLSCVQPDRAATAQMVKDVINALGVTWTSAIATACLTGIMTDTGNFKYSNTNAEVLTDAAELIRHGVDYAGLADRLQWRHPNYFKMLGKVMNTVEYHFGGLLVMARLTEGMEAEVGERDDDSNDYVGLIRYAEGSKIAILLKEKEGVTKVSARARDDVSAQAVCSELGGGGHVAAAGAKLDMRADEAQARVLAAVERELVRQDLLTPA